MSSAFDTIRRQKLLNILETIIDDDEMRLVRFLLTNTSLEIKMNNTKTEPFQTNIGSPQGDGISGCLFNVYFENALRKVRKIIQEDKIYKEHSYSKKIEITIPEELIYADDYDNITDNITKRNKFKENIKEILEKDNLFVNETKTEYTTLKRQKKTDESWRNCIKLGSKLGDAEDIINRKQLSMNSLNKLNNIWIKKDKIKKTLKLKIYKTLVKTILLYNCGTWAITKNEKKNLNSFHRRQLKIVMNITYPMIIRNKKLYKITEEQPISLEITKRRWKLFGHILRLPEDTPAQRSMIHYFTPTNNKRFNGRARITLPKTLHNDIEDTNKHNNDLSTLFKITELKNINDLQKLKELAKNRTSWISLTNLICDAAEAVTRIEESI